MLMRRQLVFSTLVVTILVRTASAQQVIADPENPGIPQSSPEGDETQLIMDPENSPNEDVTESSFSETQSSFIRSWLRGSYTGTFFFDTAHENDTEDVFLLWNRLDLRARLEIGENWTAVVEGRLEHRLWGEGNPDEVDLFVNGEHYQGVFEPSLRDAFVSGRFGSFFLTVGNQIVSWGAGTLSQPADVISPLDLRGGVLDNPAEQRIPQFAVESTLVVDRLSFSLVLVPFFQPHRFDTYGTDFSMLRPNTPVEIARLVYPAINTLVDPSLESLLQDDFIVTEYPEALPENFSGGARIVSSYGQVDLGVGYYYGWDRTPFLEIDRDVEEMARRFLGGEDVESPIDSVYLRQHTVELDLVTYFGDVGLRMESAFSGNRTVYNVGYLPRRYPVIHSALALSYEDSEDLVLQVEGFWLHAFQVPDRIDEELLLTGTDYFGAILFAHFGFGRIDALKHTFLKDLSLRFMGLAGISNREYLLFPSLGYTITDAVEAVVGAFFFGGPNTADEISIGGVFDENDQVFLSIDCAF